MIIDKNLMFFYEGHPTKDIKDGEILGSFFKRDEGGVLPEGLYEIPGNCDFCKGVTTEGYHWVFNQESCIPVLVENKEVELSAQQKIDSLEEMITKRRSREATLYSSDKDLYSHYQESFDLIQSIDEQIIELRLSLQSA